MRDENCIFCKIANGEIPPPAVYEDENFKAILDLGPAQKGHTLILPKDHYKDLTEAPEELCGKAFALAGRIGPRHTWLTHLSHAFPTHEQFCAQLKELCAEKGISSDVQPAWDGLTITA